MDTNGILKYEKNIFIENVSEKNLLKSGEVLFNNTNSQELVGKTAYFDESGLYCCSNHITRIKTNKILLPKYLKEIFSIYQRRKIFYNICTNWNNQSGINNFILSQLCIPMPPLTIQQQIVDIMDEAYKQKSQKEQEAKQLLDSINDYLLGELGITMPPEEENTLENRTFYIGSDKVLGSRFDPFYWKPNHQLQENLIINSKYKKVKILEIGIFQNGVIYKSEQECDDGKVILRANNIQLYNNSLDLNNLKYISENICISESKKLYKDDILICSASGSKEHAGKVTFIEKDLPYYYGGFMATIRVFDDECLPEYLFEYMASMFYRNALFRFLGGTNINNITSHMLNNIPVILPNKEQQLDIIYFIRNIRIKAKQLEQEAENILKTAKEQVEKILFEGSL